jgi:hypothetical protein
VKLFEISKDGGAESSVWAYWLCEFKSLFSVALLRFDGKSRDAYHSHAFDCVSWVLRGELREHYHPEHRTIVGDKCGVKTYSASWRPVVTRRETFHKVDSLRADGPTWVLTFRGPWADRWREWTRDKGHETLTHGRKVSS